MADGWSRDAALAATKGKPMPTVAIERMWIYQHDLERQMRVYVDAKTEFGRRQARVIVTMRNEGEKSFDVCSKVADMDPEVHEAHLAYRLAEQMVAANKSALQILHAELEAYRTEQANQRAADQFQTRTQP